MPANHPQTAPEESNPAACLQWAKALLRGRSVERNYEEAVRYFDIAARAGMPDALYQLGKCYLKGIGCMKDPGGGANCLERAARAGHGGAALRLGRCFQEGTGAPLSYDMARYWYMKSLFLGDPRAREALDELAEHIRSEEL